MTESTPAAAQPVPTSMWTSWIYTNPESRVQEPNSRARDMMVVAMDAPSAALGAQLADENWRGAEFSQFAQDVTDHNVDWAERMEERQFDTVVMLADAAASSNQVDAIGARCTACATKVAVILVTDGDQLSAGGEAYLANLREWAHTIAVVDRAEMVPGMLHGLGG